MWALVDGTLLSTCPIDFSMRITAFDHHLYDSSTPVDPEHNEVPGV